FAIPTAVPAMPPKPNRAATSAITRKNTAHPNIASSPLLATSPRCDGGGLRLCRDHGRRWISFAARAGPAADQPLLPEAAPRVGAPRSAPPWFAARRGESHAPAHSTQRRSL